MSSTTQGGSVSETQPIAQTAAVLNSRILHRALPSGGDALDTMTTLVRLAKDSTSSIAVPGLSLALAIALHGLEAAQVRDITRT